MLIINDEIDLGNSFDKLKQSLMESEKARNECGKYGDTNAYINLRQAVTSHLYKCTGEMPNLSAADPNDIKHINI